MEIKTLIKIFIKYELYFPLAFCKFIFYNICKIRRKGKGAILFFSRYSIFDIKESAEICLTQPVLFGWCNMRKSRLETSLYLGGGNSRVYFSGGVSNPLLIGYGSYIHVGDNAYLEIGNSFINREVKIICNKRITIGNDCIIAMGTVIRDNDGGSHKILSTDYVNSKPILIGNHVWVGENVIILKGVTIGDGAIISAGSIVTKDIPAHSLAMGIPAKVVRENVEWQA